MNKLMLLFSILLLLPTMASANYTLSDLDTKTVVRVEAFTAENESSKPDQFGTGFFISYDGCVLTNSHVVSVRLNEDPYDRFLVKQVEDIHLAPSKAIPMELLFRKIGTDTAVLCPSEKDGIFYHYFDISKPEQVKEITYGDPLAISGFPVMGGHTLTLSQGTVAGFWQQADLQSYLNLSYEFDKEAMDLIKIDAAAGPGSSGSPVFMDDNKTVLGMIFAASITPGGMAWLMTGTTIHGVLDEYYHNKRQELALEGECEFNEITKLYNKDSQEYYDPLCINPRKQSVEDIVQLNFAARCPEQELPLTRLYNATGYLLQGSSIDDWWNYLLKLCPSDKIVPSVNNNTETVESGSGVTVKGSTLGSTVLVSSRSYVNQVKVQVGE